MTTEEVKMFYGDRQIIAMENGMDEGTKRLTLAIPNPVEGGPIAETSDMPEWEANACVTSWPTDASDVRNLRAVYIVDELYTVLQRLNVRVTGNEMQFIISKLMTKVEGIRKQAMLDLYGVQVEEDIRLNAIEEKIKKV